MPRFYKRVSKKAGLTPGSPVHIGKKMTQKARVTLTAIAYDHEVYEERPVDNLDELPGYKNSPTVSWININGLHDMAVIEKIGQIFDLHPLLLEDVVNTNQRPKLEDYDQSLFLVLKMLCFDEKRREIMAEQVSFICGKNYVISFQEREGDVFDGLRSRIKNHKGKIRKLGTDYFTYALMDSIVDNYFVVLEKVGDDIELLEEELISKPDQKTLHKIHNLKKELLFLRKSIWPVREVVNLMAKIESPLISKDVEFYLRDLYDHTVQIIDTVETFRDITSGMLDTYLSHNSNKMNEVMKVLTIIATIFIPLTFVAGIYGMNFEYMPELKWRFGYAAVWGIMGAIGAAMLFFFKRKKWL